MHHGTGMAQWHPRVHATFHFLTAFLVPGTGQTFVPEWKALTSINYTKGGLLEGDICHKEYGTGRGTLPSQL